MRVRPNRRAWSIPLSAAMPMLVVAASVSADTFFWTGAGSTSWNSSTSWSGPAGQYPGTWDDTAYVNGAVNDPVVRSNHIIGFLVIQNAGHVTAGGNDPLSSLAVTSNGIHNGLALIKHAGSALTVRGSTNYRDFQCEILQIQDGAIVRMREDATIQVDNRLIVKATGVLEGNGEFDFNQTDATPDPYNDGLIHSRFGTLRFYNSGSSAAVFDIDGPSEDGRLEAWDNTTLIIDADIEPEFNGTMAINPGAELRIAADWTLAAEAGTAIDFFGGNGEERAILSGGSVTLRGAVGVNTGEAALAGPATIGSEAVVDLTAGTTLHVDDALVIDAGATFTGTGALHVSDGAQLELASGLSATLTIHNDGAMAVGGAGSGTGLVSSFAQGITGRIAFDVCRDGSDEFIVSADAVLDGELDLTAPGGCAPSPGDEFTIITAASVTGIFATVSGLPDAEVLYTADAVTVRIPTTCAADIDGDDMVAVSDLLELLGAWGPCGGCPADIDGDGSVGVVDLLAVLAAWGVCD